MKRHFLVLIAIAAFATALTTNAFGQTGKAVRAKVAFDFQIGERIYPAGEYQIESIGYPSEYILQIRSLGDGNKNEFFFARHSVGAKGLTARLIFLKYGENYFLSKIFLDTDQWGYAIRPSRRQLENDRNPALASRETIELRLATKKGIK
jgi:hypothetical protein